MFDNKDTQQLPPVSIIAKNDTEIDKNDTERRAKIFAALSDPTRLRIVELLAEYGETSGSQTANQLGISLALFCHHYKILVEAGLLQTRKNGQTKYNSLNWQLLSACFTSFKRLAHKSQN